MNGGAALSARRASRLGLLEVREPLGGELASAASVLADFYNDPYNSALICNTIHFAPSDVVDVWREMEAEPARAVLLFRDGVLVGDAAFRHLGAGVAEVGVLIGPRALQGQGLGRRFLLMVLALGFEELALERLYAAIRPENEPSLRLFARVGFVRDDTEAARAYSESPDEVCMRLDAASFHLLDDRF